MSQALTDRNEGVDKQVIPLAALPHAQPLERRRLQCYLALMIGDIFGLFAGFMISGYLYLGMDGLVRAALLTQLVLPVFMTVALYNGTYSMSALLSASDGARRCLLALGISAGVVVFIAFYIKSTQDFSRIVFTLGAALSGFLLAWLRLQMRAFIRWRCGDRVINELVIDDGGPPITLAGATSLSAERLGLVPRLDDPNALHRIGIVLHSVDRVVVSCPPGRRAAWAVLLKGANIAGEVIDDAVAELGAQGARIVDGRGLLCVSLGPLGLRARATKRLFDIAVSGFGLIVLTPLLLVTALAILVDDGSPILFVQRRVGRGNRFFDMYKFRSMHHSRSDSDGAVSARRSDARFTRIGGFIRRTSIDELPQLLNVFRGEMSMVGPRPHALGSQAGEKLFWEIDDRYWQRHALKPGLTGLAQIRGLRGATDRESDLEERLAADLEYLNGWSLWRDIGILCWTVRVIVHDKAF